MIVLETDIFPLLHQSEASLISTLETQQASIILK